ncbi:ABC transporter substrate-binding protein [Leptolyngbya sp. 'hensonii']|uniref:glycine betaine ABC transporter substrate-binding protein n=1 Tax=Leptolyngbya sp. 'hensonii' TaxID=1922337 RepID=UPI0009502588|nr:glycine betaine ABC transporter substrate-binding protein [Leptolyngbya sp. 'hensonii']OLP16012.1 ABC transporter substrate-binding protein [Leptolyngbya sp. 'hensonii']
MKLMFRNLSLICGLLAFLLVLSLNACQPGAPNRIVVASKNFTEQVILGELVAQQIEAKTGLQVDRRLNLGGTLICHQGIRAGAIDLYVEYTGTALTAVLNQAPLTNPKQVYQQVKQAYADQFALEITAPLGFNNTFAMIVRGEDARKFQIQTLSQAARYSSQWRLGVGPEFSDRPDGLPGLIKSYNLTFAAAPRVMDLGLLYQALTEKQVDMVAGNATDGLIASLKLVVLQDDRQYFPPYEAVPVIRRQTLNRHPELGKVLQELGNQISEADMRRLNYQVDGEKQEVRQVVQAFRQGKGW